MQTELPPFQDWSIAAVKLLQGAIESDETKAWNLLASNRTTLEEFMARLGLAIVVNDQEGFAYLVQLNLEEAPDGYDRLPKLFQASRLGYHQTLLCVLLRDALRRFEDEQTHDEICVVEETRLLEEWKLFFPHDGDDVKQLRNLRSHFAKLADLKFVRQFGLSKGSWEVRRILKARLTADDLASLYQQLQSESTAT